MVVFWIISLLTVFVALIRMIPDKSDIEEGRLTTIIIGMALVSIVFFTLIYTGVQIWFIR